MAIAHIRMHSLFLHSYQCELLEIRYMTFVLLYELHEFFKLPLFFDHGVYVLLKQLNSPLGRVICKLNDTAERSELYKLP